MVFKCVTSILAVLLMVGCHHSQEDSTEASLHTIEMSEMPHDIFLPTKLWDTITGASFEKSVREASNILFAPISVRLSEKTEGVLAAPELRLNFPKGGGQVDWAKYIKADRGTFRLFFDFEGFSNPADLSIYYVSKSKKRRLDDEIFGSGCHTFYDIKAYLLKVNAKEGLSLNVTRERHDSAVGGYFVFSYKQDKQTFISAVNFVDSGRPDLFCEDKRK